MLTYGEQLLSRPKRSGNIAGSEWDPGRLIRPLLSVHAVLDGHPSM